MKLDFLFGRRDSAPAPHIEPLFDLPPRPLRPTPVRREAPRSAAPRLAAPIASPDLSPQYMSPRQLAAWAHEMYLAGAMSWQEYQTALPAELHPDYDMTVGALTGEPARPDEPRDMLVEWEEKLAFIKRYNPWDADEVRRADRIVTLLRRQAHPGQWMAAE